MKVIVAGSRTIHNFEMAKYADGAVILWDGSSTGTRHMINFMEIEKKPCYVVKYRQYKFQDFEMGVQELARKIRNGGHHFDYIVGLSRGGLIPATWLSYKLDIPLVPIQWSMTGVQESNCWIADDIFKGKRVLIVDDIVDNGDTIRSLIKDWQSDIAERVLMLANIEVATLVYNKQQQEVQVDYCVDSWIIDREKEADWIEFWWDH